MGKAVLITGGAGLLAINWARAVRDRSPVGLAFHERQVQLRGVSGRTVDLESPKDLDAWIESAEAGAVVHTAGLTSVEACEADPERARRVNVELAANVAAACARANVPFVHISTDHLFGSTQDLVEEDQPVSPVNVYGRTKAEAETRVLEANPASLVVRTNFYGWGTSYRRSFSDSIIDALRADREIVLFHDVWYTPILMDALIASVHGLLDARASGIFHVSGDDMLSKYEFGRRLAAQFGLEDGRLRPGSLGNQPRLVRRPRSMGLANGKAARALGRKLGGVGDHVPVLDAQERTGVAAELRAL